MILWTVFWTLTMEDVELRAAGFAIGRLQDAMECSHEAVLSAMRTLPRRPAGSKPSERVGDSVHEESKSAK